MSFWNLSTGEQVEATTEFESGGGNMEPMPAGTTTLSVIDEAKWDSKGEGYDKVEFVSVRWSVMKPEQYQNRKVFQKLWVKDGDPNVKDLDKSAKKKDKAIRMLSAIDQNAGGKLMAAGREPTDDDLQSALVGKAMMTSLQVWEMTNNGETASGNWVAAVSAKGSKEPKAGEVKGSSGGGSGGTTQQSDGGSIRDLDDEIPF